MTNLHQDTAFIPVILQVAWVLLSSILPNHIVYYAHRQDSLSAYKQLELFWVYIN